MHLLRSNRAHASGTQLISEQLGREGVVQLAQVVLSLYFCDFRAVVVLFYAQVGYPFWHELLVRSEDYAHPESQAFQQAVQSHDREHQRHTDKHYLQH